MSFNNTLSIAELFNSYKSWVSKNPQSLGDWENSAKWISYFIAGRINNSYVISELIYCLSNLLVLFNDVLIRRSNRINCSTSAEKLKLWLTVIEYSEVFCELSARRLWGVTGKWVVIVSIQIFKCVSRLLLVYHYKEPLVQSPAVPLLDRKRIAAEEAQCVNDMRTQFESASFTLKRSGRVVRKVDSSPPINLRSWKPLEGTRCENNQSIEYALENRHRVAETIYIVKPVVHLAAMAYCGTKTWKPWAIAAALDLTSLQLYRYSQKKNLASLTPQQRLQLSKRSVILVLYLIRSPMYEKWTRTKLDALLMMIGKYIPLAGLISTPLAQYLPFWQNTYFYMWST